MAPLPRFVQRPDGKGGLCLKVFASETRGGNVRWCMDVCQCGYLFPIKRDVCTDWKYGQYSPNQCVLQIKLTA